MQSKKFPVARISISPSNFVTGSNEKIFAAGPVFGIEIGHPRSARRCVVNLDHHGLGDTINSPSAVKQAMTCELPSEDSILALMYPSADSVAAMAVLRLRAAGEEIKLIDLVNDIDSFDRLGPAAIQPTREVLAIHLKAQDQNLSLEERVKWVEDILIGKDNVREIAAIAARHEKNLEAARKDAEIEVVADGKIVYVASKSKLAMALGFEKASVVVAFNPQMPFNGKRPGAGSYGKYTVSRYNSHVPIDLIGALRAFQEKEPGWGGRGDWLGSPIGRSSKLQIMDVVDEVAKHFIQKAA